MRTHRLRYGTIWIYDLRFSLAGHGRLISFFRHIGEESNPHRRFAALGHCVRSALVPSLAATPRSRYTPFGVPENMSKRELKALQVAPVPRCRCPAASEGSCPARSNSDLIDPDLVILPENLICLYMRNILFLEYRSTAFVQYSTPVPFF